MHRETRGGFECLALLLYTLFTRDQQAPVVLLCLLVHNYRVIGMHVTLPRFLPEFWWFELRFFILAQQELLFAEGIPISF